MKRRESVRHAKTQLAKAMAERISTAALDTDDFMLISVNPFDDEPGVRVEARVRVEHPQYEGGEAWESISFDVVSTEVTS